MRSDGSLDNLSAIEGVKLILKRALSLRASDVHLEPCEEGLRVRFRSDGILRDVMYILDIYALRLVTRIKVLSQLDIGERRLPQDGKFMVASATCEPSALGDVDIRVATFPTRLGEKIVLRILNQEAMIQNFTGLGLSQEQIIDCEKLLLRSQGFVLVTGPTGSGKTTTLYTMLLNISRNDKNVVTLEDPIEYTVPGVIQTQIRSDIGFDFHEGMRALVRQDPDIIMIGEIRDSQTAQAAIRAALTGHLVLSTLHTTDAVGSIIRLIDMGIEPFLINATVTGVLAQRLVRKLCTQCRISEGEQEYPFESDTFMMRQRRGCDACAGTGYYGRTGIFELLQFSPQLRTKIAQRASYEDVLDIACKEGMVTLWDDAMYKVKRGVTSMSEVLRVLA